MAQPEDLPPDKGNRLAQLPWPRLPTRDKIPAPNRTIDADKKTLPNPTGASWTTRARTTGHDVSARPSPTQETRLSLRLTKVGLYQNLLRSAVHNTERTRLR